MKDNLEDIIISTVRISIGHIAKQAILQHLCQVRSSFKSIRFETRKEAFVTKEAFRRRWVDLDQFFDIIWDCYMYWTNPVHLIFWLSEVLEDWRLKIVFRCLTCRILYKICFEIYQKLGCEDVMSGVKEMYYRHCLLYFRSGKISVMWGLWLVFPRRSVQIHVWESALAHVKIQILFFLIVDHFVQHDFGVLSAKHQLRVFCWEWLITVSISSDVSYFSEFRQDGFTP